MDLEEMLEPMDSNCDQDPNPTYPHILTKTGRVEYVSLGELRDLQDERNAKRELHALQEAAERQLKTRIVKDHF